MGIEGAEIGGWVYGRSNLNYAVGFNPRRPEVLGVHFEDGGFTFYAVKQTVVQWTARGFGVMISHPIPPAAWHERSLLSLRMHG